jgi:hypothetical protein
MNPPFQLCELLGIPFDPEGITSFQGRLWDVPWDGAKMNGRKASLQKQRYQELFHEIGHWLVAAPEFRGNPTFSLGMAYDTCPGKNLSPDAVAEEVKASAVGILLHATCADPRGSWAHAEEHMWMDYSDTWNLLQDEVPGPVRKRLYEAGIVFPLDKPKNWRSR